MKKHLRTCLIIWILFLILGTQEKLDAGYVMLEKLDGTREILFQHKHIEMLHLEIFRTAAPVRRAVLLDCIAEIGDARAALVLAAFLSDHTPVDTNAIPYKKVGKWGRVSDYAVSGLDRRFYNPFGVPLGSAEQFSAAHKQRWEQGLQKLLPLVFTPPPGSQARPASTNTSAAEAFAILKIQRWDAAAVARVETLAESGNPWAPLALGFLVLDESRPEGGVAGGYDTVNDLAAQCLDRYYRLDPNRNPGQPSEETWRAWFRAETSWNLSRASLPDRLRQGK